MSRQKIRAIEKIYDKKFGFTIGYSMGSKSKTNLMKSYENIKKEVGPKLKNKKGKRSDIISKSLLKGLKASPTHSGGVRSRY